MTYSIYEDRKKFPDIQEVVVGNSFPGQRKSAGT
jgi:hypothetical protein